MNINALKSISSNLSRTWDHSHSQSPEFEIAKVFEKLCTSQWVRHSICSIGLDSPDHQMNLGRGEEALPGSFVGKVDNEEPRCNCDELCDQTL